MKLPYPFAGDGAQVSSKGQILIPFPPSPGSRKEKRRSPVSSGSESQQSSGPERVKEEAKEENVEEEEEDKEEEDEDEEMEENSEAHPRTSGSMSSLSEPVSRYPFQFCRPHAHGASVSSSAMTHSLPSSNLRSAYSRSTQSTGNHETLSESPMSQAVSGTHLQKLLCLCSAIYPI